MIDFSVGEDLVQKSRSGMSRRWWETNIANREARRSPVAVDYMKQPEEEIFHWNIRQS